MKCYPINILIQTVQYHAVPNLPEEYFLGDIDRETLSKEDFDIDEDLDKDLNDEVKTLINSMMLCGTDIKR